MHDLQITTLILVFLHCLTLKMMPLFNVFLDCLTLKILTSSSLLGLPDAEDDYKFLSSWTARLWR